MTRRESIETFDLRLEMEKSILKEKRPELKILGITLKAGDLII